MLGQFANAFACRSESHRIGRTRRRSDPLPLGTMSIGGDTGRCSW
ncbi:hypothetical protein ACFMQL_36755 [Nonomuraea fastidiosa]